MTQYPKILTGLVILLAIFNVILIGFIWTNRLDPAWLDRKNEDTPQIRGGMLQDKLDFTEEQTIAFRKALREHHQAMAGQRRNLCQLKNQVNQAIILSDSTKLQQANEELFEVQKKIERKSQEFTAFLSSLCTEQQRHELLDIYENALDRRYRRHRQSH